MLLRSLALLLMSVVVAGAVEVPPSPSLAPGIALEPVPAITHWPAITYPDERATIAVRIPVTHPGGSATIGWRGGSFLPIVFPDLPVAACLLPLTTPAVGERVAQVTVDDLATVDLPITLHTTADAWPQVALVDGQPVDRTGRPVVLVDQRRNATAQRHLAAVAAFNSPRGAGTALVVGDPMTLAGSALWQGMPARFVPVTDDRFPANAMLVALAQDQARWITDPPRTILVVPPPRCQDEPADQVTEQRLLTAIQSRCEALGTWPRLVLVLPALAQGAAADAARVVASQARRDDLRLAAQVAQWIVLDQERLAGPSEESHRLAEGVSAAVPVGEARDRMRAALARELAK